MARYDTDEIRSLIGPDDIFDLLGYLGGEPRDEGAHIVAKTICHHGDSHKLYYYKDSELFFCYSDSCGSFDVFGLVQRVLGCGFPMALNYVVSYFGLEGRVREAVSRTKDWDVFDRHDDVADDDGEDTCAPCRLEEVDNPIRHYPLPHIEPWERDGITYETCERWGIKYDPVHGGILIPHHDADGRLVGIRERTLVKDDERFGKYRPARIGEKMYNHPLAFNLYGLHENRDAIGKFHVAIVAEGEKSVLQAESILGRERNVTVAVCGSSISRYQMGLLMGVGVNEVVVAFDKDFHEVGDDDFKRVCAHLMTLNRRYGSYVRLSFMFDKYDLLGYKESPFDGGADKFDFLWRRRVSL